MKFLSTWHVKSAGWILLILLVAVLLRLIHLAEIPSCLEYDEAANVVLAGEIARGEAFPIFIRPYTGKEVLYFYLAAASMALAGITPFALRLASVICGVANVALTYFCVHELLAGGGSKEKERRWLALVSAALVAVSYWQVNLSRLGYRAISLPPLLALTIGLWFRGLRKPRWYWMALSGAAAGLSAYTYSSVRVFPALLLLLWLWAILADRRQWSLRLVHLLAFGAAAAIVFAPLGIFFMHHPETLSVRLSQVSVFSPQVNQGDLWGTLQQTVRLAFGMFTVSGDMNPLYNLAGKPVFDAWVGPFFYLGLGLCLWRLLRPNGRVSPAPGALVFSRLPYLALLAWLLVMMVPNVLSASGVPHNLRAMALVPAVFIVTALGLVVPTRWLGALLARFTRWGAIGRALPAAILLLLLGYEGASTYDQYVHIWAPSALPYYKGNEALIHAASLIDAHPEADPYVATYFQQHATLAVASRRYEQIRWMSGQTLVLPPPGAPPALLIYDHTYPLDPLLRDRYLSDRELFHQELGPDGKVAYEAYLVSQSQGAGALSVQPQFPLQANLGHTLRLLGYDLNAPARSGENLDVTLYFQVLRAVDRNDYAFFAHLVDDLGFHWASDTFFEYPSGQWRPGEVLIMRHQFEIAVGAPRSTYALSLGAFSASLDARLPALNEKGQMIGTTVSLAPIPVERAAAPPQELPPMQQRTETTFDDAVTLVGSDRDRSDLRPGETLALTLYWQAREGAAQAQAVSIWLSGAEGDIPLWEGHPVHGRYPFRQWQTGEFVRDRYALRLPVGTPDGDLNLRLAVHARNGTPLSVEGAEWLSLGTIHVHATDRLWEPPPFAHTVGAQLGDKVELLGYDLGSNQVRPGDTLQLTLIWRCRGTMDTAYTVFTHLLDQEEQVRGQQDNPPQRGTYPTTLWLPGEVVVDSYEIPVAANAAPGTYTIEVGLYDPLTMQRLPVRDPTGGMGDRILLGSIEVAEAP